MSTHRHTFIIAALILLIAHAWAFGDWKENARVIDISGGEDHTLILTADKRAWACGPIGGYHVDVEYYYGVLGMGNTSWSHFETSLLKVHDGAMTTDSNCLEDITEIDAGWKHSLALDVNGFVWSWGWNREGQCGNGESGNFVKDFA